MKRYPFHVEIPEVIAEGIAQGEEYCFVTYQGKTSKILFHSYRTLLRQS